MKNDDKLNVSLVMWFGLFCGRITFDRFEQLSLKEIDYGCLLAYVIERMQMSQVASLSKGQLKWCHLSKTKNKWRLCNWFMDSPDLFRFIRTGQIQCMSMTLVFAIRRPVFEIGHQINWPFNNVMISTFIDILCPILLANVYKSAQYFAHANKHRIHTRSFEHF